MVERPNHRRRPMPRALSSVSRDHSRKSTVSEMSSHDATSARGRPSWPEEPTVLPPAPGTGAATDAALRQLLCSRGLRVTWPRLAVLVELQELGVPTSYPELTERLARFGLNRTTIYRILRSLTEAGILVRTQLGDAVSRFDFPRAPAGDHRLHPHFVCNSCGGLSCLPAGAVSLHTAALKNEVAEVQLRGRCAVCLQT